MTILKAMQCYATGTLSELDSPELEKMQDAVIEKIDQMETIVRCNDLSPELMGDYRTYQTIRDVIALEMESRTSSNRPRACKSKAIDPVLLYMSQLARKMENDALLQKTRPA